MGVEKLQANEIEKGILGHLLMYSEDFERVKEFIGLDSFYKESHNLVFRAMNELHKRSLGVDLLSVFDEMSKQGTIEKIGGIIALNELSDHSHVINDIDYKCKIITDFKIKRDIIALNHKITQDILQGGDPYDSLLESNAFYESVQSNNNVSNSGDDISNLVCQSVANYEKREKLALSGEIAGIRSCINEVTEHLSGWQGNTLNVIGGRPGMGKTAYALAEAKKMSSCGEYPCFFSLEMGSVSLADRLLINQALSMFSDLEEGFYDRFKKGKLDAMEKKALYDAHDELSRMNLYIDDRASCTVAYIKQACKLRKAKGKCSAIFIDYLQLLADDDVKNGNREQQVSRMSRGLKLIAKELDVPVFLLAQLNRSVEQRVTKQPTLSDLRESGAIEQDADTIIFPWRPLYYINFDNSFENAVSTAYSSDFPNVDWKKSGLLIFAKDRHNGTTKILIDINKSCTTWRDHDGINNNSVTPVLNGIKQDETIDPTLGLGMNNDFDNEPPF